MSSFLKETIAWKQFELLIDTRIFPKDIILKAAYNHLDKWYFFFKFDEDKNMIVEFRPKEWVNIDPYLIIWEFSDELLDMYLRDKLEKENRIIREAIVTKSLLWPLDTLNYVSHNPEENIWEVRDATVKKEMEQQSSAEIDFDKDIDAIIKEIENDPDLQVDEEEIQQMLREIEEESWETKLDDDKPIIRVEKDSITGAKDLFQKNSPKKTGKKKTPKKSVSTKNKTAWKKNS